MELGWSAPSIPENEWPCSAFPIGFSQLDRLLDPKNTAVSLVTLARAAALSGKRLVVEIRDQHPVTVIEPKAKRSPSSPLDVCINRCNSLREFATLRLPIFPCAGIPTLNNPHRLLDLFDGLGKKSHLYSLNKCSITKCAEDSQ